MNSIITDDLSNSQTLEDNASSVAGSEFGDQQKHISAPKVLSATITPRSPSRAGSRTGSRGGSAGGSQNGSRSGSPKSLSRGRSPKRKSTTPGDAEPSELAVGGSSSAKMNYAPVWKPGFQNRRNQSSYLKKAFPAGFQLKIMRSQLSGDHFDHVLHEASKAGTMRIDDSTFSFVNWTKGGSGSIYDDEDDVNKNGDPFADCAGPTLEDLQRARRELKQAPTFDYVPNDPACIVRRATITSINEHPQHNHAIQRQQKKSSPNRLNTASESSIGTAKSSLSNIKVFHAPARMPTLNPVLNNSSSFIMNNQAGATRRVFTKQEFSEQYEKWIQDRRSNIGDKTWKTKGNNVEFNYSAHSFNGSPTNTNTKKRVQSTLPIIPRPWRPEIGVEIYTTNQLIRTKTSEDFDKQYVYKVISSESSLADLRLNIAHDIVDGIKRAFPDLPSLLNLTSAEEYHKIVPIKLEKIEMSFQYYHPEVTAWRPLASEVEWVECKNLVTYFGGNMQIMYCLSPPSEEILVNQIKKNYELQQAALAKRRPPISIEDLTDALAAETKRKQKRNASMPKLPQANESLKQKTLRLPLTESTESSDPSSNGKKVLSQAGHRSVLYPQSSAKLKLMQSQSEASMQRLEAFASNLEGRILKTKW
jgi:hypothetical protein